MSVVTPQPHHIRGEESGSRPLYRRGRRATAVKVFTIADESIHILVFGVPAINLQEELTKLALSYGTVHVFKVESYPDLQPFTEVFHLQYTRIAEARAAKKRLDGLEFFGGVLHVCYASELEKLEETRSKLIQRSKMVHARMSAEERSTKIISGFGSKDTSTFASRSNDS